MSTIQSRGRRGRGDRITSVSPSCGVPSRGLSPSFPKIVTGEPTRGAKPPKGPVPAAASREKKAPAAAAGATVTAGTRLRMRPRPSSTSTSR
ncbi:hypothetical protein [Fretibacterium fastidiosum]|uniref:Uncharacterized protein n=1 Tax=Fretibacterium fastidiosum TaxID=651822 RepID=A0AB94IW16_9BACT|nr:hypothetical protein [Fretibacterium fastidiosum]CBL27933.1 hypothetical protein SY1_05200 [Fretibacterium fastidiosum]